MNDSDWGAVARGLVTFAIVTYFLARAKNGNDTPSKHLELPQWVGSAVRWFLNACAPWVQHVHRLDKNGQLPFLVCTWLLLMWLVPVPALGLLYLLLAPLAFCAAVLFGGTFCGYALLCAALFNVPQADVIQPLLPGKPIYYEFLGFTSCFLVGSWYRRLAPRVYRHYGHAAAAFLVINAWLAVTVVLMLCCYSLQPLIG